MTMSRPLLLLLLLIPPSNAWNRWTSTALGPGARSGHSLLLFNDTAYLFGGRGNDVRVHHDPRTFTTERVNGTVQVTSYNSTHVVDCFDPVTGVQLDPDVHVDVCAPQYEIPIGSYYNDLWSYPLNCTRAGVDGGCTDAGWAPVVRGAPLGGCKNYEGALACTHPQERVDASAAILWERQPTFGQQRTLGNDVSIPAHLIVYGGYSELCGDYCSDMWHLPLTDCLHNSSLCAWKPMTPKASAVASTGDPAQGLGRTGPGRRWRSASSADDTRWVLFGGHRMWHGLATANSLENRWADTVQYAHGGFLDDLWVFVWDTRGVWGAAGYAAAGAEGGYGQGTAFGKAPTPRGRELSLDEPVVIGGGAWQQVLPREQCNSGPGVTWASRNDIACTIVWPRARAQAATALMGESLYLHGGYAISAYPYPHVLASGSGPGVSSLASGSVSAYPTQPSFFDDLWVFSWITGLWVELTPTSLRGILPPARRGHSLVLASSGALLLFGGYASGSYMNDMWSYNTSANHWLQSTVFPRPLFVPNCTTRPAVLDPDPANSGSFLPPNDLGGGSPVQGEPTRGTNLDGLFGRASKPVTVPQGVRRALGWDGCRDRADERGDLPAGITYLKPSARAGHASVWSNTWGIMLSYGGEAQEVEELPTTSMSYAVTAVGDLWAWGRSWCPGTPYEPEGTSALDCSGHGDCVFGNCYCRDGYYGADCSNATCPSDFCQYDTLNHVQTCTHCCSLWEHVDGEVYVPGERKSPCDSTHAGFSHGICDGGVSFPNPPGNDSTNPLPGSCQCAPPYIGDDCSVRDCPNGCSIVPGGPSHYCSVEYPVARCICEPPYTAADCSELQCPNNCSYPNGLCDTKTGVCTCAAILSPYYNLVNWSAYGGVDCSYVPAFAGATSPSPHPLLPLAVLLASVVAVILSSSLC